MMKEKVVPFHDELLVGPTVTTYYHQRIRTSWCRYSGNIILKKVQQYQSGPNSPIDIEIPIPLVFSVGIPCVHPFIPATEKCSAMTRAWSD